MEKTTYPQRTSRQECGTWSNPMQVHTLHTNLQELPFHGKLRRGLLSILKLAFLRSVSQWRANYLEFNYILANLLNYTSNIVTLVYTKL